VDGAESNADSSSPRDALDRSRSPPASLAVRVEAPTNDDDAASHPLNTLPNDGSGSVGDGARPPPSSPAERFDVAAVAVAPMHSFTPRTDPPRWDPLRESNFGFIPTLLRRERPLKREPKNEESFASFEDALGKKGAASAPSSPVDLSPIAPVVLTDADRSSKANTSSSMPPPSSLATARGDGNGIPPLAERRCVFASRGVGPSRRSDENRLSNDAEGATSGAGADFSRTSAGASLAIPSKERNTASPRRLCSSSSASFRERASPLLVVALGGSSLSGGAHVGGGVVVGGATREPSASA
jgi:hypothetical protein